MVSTTSNRIKRDASNKKWITKEEFKEVYPKGYRECNFFSSPVEFWSMSKEACLNWKRTTLIDLSSKLNIQNKLQQTSIIGNSSDTKLLTELLNLNHNDSKIEFINKEISKTKACYTCNNVCTCLKLLSNRLKNNLEITNDEKVAVLSKTQLGFPDIQIIDQFDKSSFPDIQLIDQFENSCMVQVESNSELKKNKYDNYLTLLQETANNIESRSTTPIENEVVDIETASTQIIHESRATTPIENEVVDIETASTQIIHESRATTPIENEVVDIETASTQIIHESRATTTIENEVVDIERASTQIIQDESTIDENNEYNDVLKYFHLNSISDIFQNLQEDDIMDDFFTF